LKILFSVATDEQDNNIPISPLRKSFSFTGGTSAGNTNTIDDHYDLFYSISGGVGVSVSDNNMQKIYMDINGDGLPDIVETGNMSIVGKLIEGITNRNDADMTSLIKKLKKDTLFVFYNTGLGFTEKKAMPININLSRSTNTSLSINGAFTFGFSVFLMKVTLTPSGSGSWNISSEMSQFVDFNNDGLPDIVTAGTDGKIKVRYAIPPKCNLLSSIGTPVYLSIIIDYDLTPYSTTESPNRSWNMSSCMLQLPDGTSALDYPQKNLFEYENRRYDRFEREDYGYQTVRTKIVNDNTYNWETILRSTHSNWGMIDTVQSKMIIEDTYHNDSHLFKGLKTSTTVKNDKNQILKKQVFVYKLKDISMGTEISAENAHCFGSAWVALAIDSTLFYEKHSDPQIISVEKITHGAYGNIAKCEYLNDINTSNDDVILDTVTYYIDTNKYIILPSEMKYHAAGSPFVYTKTAQYNSHGSVRSLVNNNMQYDMSHDEYGNITRITLPANGSGMRTFKTIEYDNVLHALPVKVKDNFGYYSTTKYDYRFQVPTKTVDIGGAEMIYAYDSKGRLKMIKTPKDPDYTLKYKYWDTEQMPAGNYFLPVKWVKTLHYNPDNPSNDIEIRTENDALGRIYCIKRDAVVGGQDVILYSGLTFYDFAGNLVIATTIPLLPDDYQKRNNILESPHEVHSYDEFGRRVKTRHPDGAETYIGYDIARGVLPDGSLDIPRFRTSVTNFYGHTSLTYKDVRDLQVRTVSPLGAQTHFFYDGLGNLLKTIDPEGHSTMLTLDILGRTTQIDHPSRGVTSYFYDGTTADPSYETNPIGGLKYDYDDLGRPIYKGTGGDNMVNDIYYEYGAPNTGYQSGKLIRMQDATGITEYEYGNMGEVTAETRTHSLPSIALGLTHRTEWEYDSWGKTKRIHYPDGETVYYFYNNAGQLQSFRGSLYYINDIAYNQLGQKEKVYYGNGTVANYYYDYYTQRLLSYDLHGNNGRDLMFKNYEYDVIGNIVYRQNEWDDPLIYSWNSYEYDADNRLVYSFCDEPFHRGSYYLSMEYSPAGRILDKHLQSSRNIGELGNISWYGFDNYYSYDAPANPYAVTSMGGDGSYYWDKAGNLTFKQGSNSDNSSGIGYGSHYFYWTPDNRMQAYASDNTIAYYRYDASGEREMKLVGTVQNGWNNGRPISIPIYDNATLYASPLMTIDKRGYTKHYFAEGERIASSIGGGGTPLVNEIGTAVYQLSQKFSTFVENYFDNHTYGRNASITFDAPAEFDINYPLNDYYQGLRHDQSDKPYFFHTDHLGGSSMITDESGDCYQILDYMPTGELFMELKKVGNYSTPYRFTGHEQDKETGLHYAGARYYFDEGSIFISTDPKWYAFPSVTPYNYCLNNPIRYIDPDGKLAWPVREKYNGYGRSHLNNWHEVRAKKGGGTRLHNGLDINHKGGGNIDLGAPIVATHDGYLSRIVTDDKNAGGRRIVVTSQDGTVSTSYMHLSEVANLKVGDPIAEGQEIGKMGGSGFGKDDAYTSHLHYELRVNGVNTNPVGADGNLIDPQSLLGTQSNVIYNGGTLPEVTVTAPSAARPRALPLLPVKPVERPTQIDL
jgi:RHS repeat-associated protein